LRTNILRIKGRSKPGATVTVNGGHIAVGADGTFNEFVTLDKPGQQVVLVRATSLNGGVSERRQSVVEQMTPAPLPSPKPAESTAPAATGPGTNARGMERTDVTLRAEVAFWESIKDSKDAADFEEYLSKYPSGEYAGVAGRRLESLKHGAATSGARAGPPRWPTATWPVFWNWGSSPLQSCRGNLSLNADGSVRFAWAGTVSTGGLQLECKGTENFSIALADIATIERATERGQGAFTIRVRTGAPLLLTMVGFGDASEIVSTLASAATAGKAPRP
jgi:hypothetical protein